MAGWITGSSRSEGTDHAKEVDWREHGVAWLWGGTVRIGCWRPEHGENNKDQSRNKMR